MAQGGGRGTFFIRTAFDYEELQKRLRKRVWYGVALHSASVHRFIDGIPASTVLCVTRHGVIVSALQEQLIDLPYCAHIANDGVFCGHSWQAKPWPSPVAAEAGRQSRKIGAFLAALGYRGIAGIDFLIERQNEQVYPLELNPRITGALPMLSMLQAARGMIPFEVFHMLEFLGHPYEIDVEGLNECYAGPIEGSHVILFLLDERNRMRADGLRAGLYEHTAGPDQARFVKGALDYRDFSGEGQFIIVDGPPDPQRPSQLSPDPLYRLCRILFPYPVSGDTGGLMPPARRAIDWVYQRVIADR